jgi:Parkin co-regulated protein
VHCLNKLLMCRYGAERPDPSVYLRKGDGVVRAMKSTQAKALPQPPKAGARARRDNPPNTAFRRFYERGDLPIAVEHRGTKNVISWKVRSCAVSTPPYTLLAIHLLTNLV